jgi:DMSO/TMAO reductase YedYZ molybdopterin-dependent catalytic subunit
MKKGLSVIFILTLVLGLIVLGLFIYINFSQRIIQLPYAEVTNYNGTKLDSINNIQENAIKGIQYINITNYSLKIDGLVENPKNYSYGQVISHQNYEKVVQLNCVEGWSANILWQGILVKDLFDEAKPLPNATVIIFHASDGYTVNFPVDYFSNKSILMAYRMNNVTIPPAQGFPFMLVAEDKWGYKWIKWITEIEFSSDTNYTGYWESRGYSKEGDLNESFIA